MGVSKAFIWFTQHPEDVKRYAGKHVAIVDDGVAMDAQIRGEAIGEETFGQIRREIRSRTRLSPLLHANLRRDMNLLSEPTKDADRRPGARTVSSDGRDSV